MPPQEFRDEHTPFGYLITFRSYGTWLHGRSGSVDRFHNTYGTSRLRTNAARLRYNQRALSQSPVTLKPQQRALVEEAIRETCEIRKWSLWAVNVRTNHVHAVVTADCKPERVLNALKANSTHQMREASCWKVKEAPGLRAEVNGISGLKSNWSMRLSMFRTIRENL